MRSTWFLLALALAACTPANTNNESGDTNLAADALNAHVEASPDAKAAQARAAEYLKLLSAGKFADAHAIWDDGGKASGGSVADLKRVYSIYSKFEGQAGEPSEIKTSDGKDYATVAATGKGVLAKTGATRELGGVIYLRRAHADAKTAGQPGSEWKIWGVDMRRPH